MALTTVREILDTGDLVGLETDSNTVIWGEARRMREAMKRCDLKIGDVIDYTLDDTGRVAGFTLFERHA